MTPSQQKINSLLESQAAEVSRLMKICDAKGIHHSHSPHVLHANLKLQGIMSAAMELGIQTDHFRWSMAITPKIFGEPEQSRPQRPRTSPKQQQARP